MDLPGRPGDSRGVLCIHGFTSSPFEVGYLAQRLHQRGMTVVAPLLPGHGTTVDDLDHTTWQQWVAAVDSEYDKLRARCRHVAVVGQSLGGLLTLDLAARRPEVEVIASLAAPLTLEGISARVAKWTGPGGWLHGRFRTIPKIGGSDVLDAEAKRTNPAYGAVPLRALAELVSFMKHVDDELPKIKAPLLVVHAQNDHTAPVSSAHRIAAIAHAARLRILSRSYHLIAIDVERDVVAEEVGEFFEKHFAAAIR